MNEHEEGDILESYEQSEWQSVKHLQEEVIRYQAYAVDAIAQMSIVTIELPLDDLYIIQHKAEEAGISYQKLASQILQKFASGKLIENSTAL